LNAECESEALPRTAHGFPVNKIDLLGCIASSRLQDRAYAKHSGQKHETYYHHRDAENEENLAFRLQFNINPFFRNNKN
jgi:hypothetical protein